MTRYAYKEAGFGVSGKCFIRTGLEMDVGQGSQRDTPLSRMQKGFSMNSFWSTVLKGISMDVDGGFRNGGDTLSPCVSGCASHHMLLSGVPLSSYLSKKGRLALGETLTENFAKVSIRETKVKERAGICNNNF